MGKYLKNFVRITVLMLVIFSCTKEKVENEPSTPIASDVQSEREIITLKSGVEVEKRGDIYILGGDIVLTNEQLKSLDDLGGIFYSDDNEQIDTKDAIMAQTLTGMRHYFQNRTAKEDNQVYSNISTKAFGQYPTPYNLWAMVRYTLDANLSSSQLTAIRNAMTNIETNTNVRFYNATGEPTIVGGVPCDWVHFYNHGSVNNSYVGRIGGKQILNLSSGAVTSTVIHEICHALGLQHEHQRFDRDTYVNVNLSNVATSDQHNFTKITSNYYAVGSFDWNSIMLYNSFAFAVNPAIAVMTRKDNGNTFWDATILSALDRSWINGLYLPYLARPDTWADLAPTVYKADNSIMTSLERENLIRSLNNGSLPPPIPTYQVSFDLNGASGTPPSNQTIVWGGYATKPSPNPIWSGCTFVDWYDNINCTGSAVNFSTYKITGIKTFYAKWNCPNPPTVYLKIVNNSYKQVNGSIQIPGSGFYQGISMGPNSTSPSSGWNTIALTPGTYYIAQALISNYNDPPPWYQYVYLHVGTSSSPPQIAQWTSGWDGSSQDRSISLTIVNGMTYYIIVNLN